MVGRKLNRLWVGTFPGSHELLNLWGEGMSGGETEGVTKPVILRV